MAMPPRDEPFPNTRFISGQPTLGDGTHLADGVLIDCHAPVRIGRGTFCGHRVMILTGSHNMFAFGAGRRADATPRPVTIGEWVWICSGAIICPGVTIGDHAVIGPGAVVMRNVAAYTLVAGNPARVVRRLRSKTHAETQDTR
jgi:maltose O-acetyltransferase